MIIRKLKYAIKISQEDIVSAKRDKLICADYLRRDQWICVDVSENGYTIPNSVNIISSEHTAKKACSANNRCSGYTESDVELIISYSMNLVHGLIKNRNIVDKILNNNDLGLVKLCSIYTLLDMSDRIPKSLDKKVLHHVEWAIDEARHKHD